MRKGEAQKHFREKETIQWWKGKGGTLIEGSKS